MFCSTAALLFFLHLGFVEINRDIKATFCLFQGIFFPPNLPILTIVKCFFSCKDAKLP